MRSQGTGRFYLGAWQACGRIKAKRQFFSGKGKRQKSTRVHTRLHICRQGEGRSHGQENPRKLLGRRYRYARL